MCKQQPSCAILIKPKCQKPCNWYRMSVVWGKKTSFSRCYISEIPQDLNFISWMALKTEGVTSHSSEWFNNKFCHISEQIYPWKMTLFCQVQPFSLSLHKHSLINIAYIMSCSMFTTGFYETTLWWMDKGHSRGTSSMLHAHFRVERNYVLQYLETKSLNHI